MRSLMPYRDRLNFWDLDLFDSLFDSSKLNTKELKVHMKEEDDKFVVLAEVPGLTESQLNVTYENGVLSIDAHYDVRKEGENNISIRKSAYYWNYKIDGIKADKISAELKNGILKVDLPKNAESKAQKITIKNKN